MRSINDNDPVKKDFSIKYYFLKVKEKWKIYACNRTKIIFPVYGCRFFYIYIFSIINYWRISVKKWYILYIDMNSFKNKKKKPIAFELQCIHLFILKAQLTNWETIQEKLNWNIYVKVKIIKTVDCSAFVL